jgi:hypothetical protein
VHVPRRQSLRQIVPTGSLQGLIVIAPGRICFEANLSRRVGEILRHLAALERIHDLASDYIHFLHPVRKLVSKTRTGPRVTRRYDIAQTPYHRLLDSGALSMKMTNELKTRSRHLDPYRLKVQLEAAQRTLTARAVRSDSYVRQP